MEQVFGQLGQLFVQTIPTVILVFVLVVVLDRLFFRPLIQVMERREAATVGALARAREKVSMAEEKARQYEAALQSGRQEVYRQREADRHAAMADREAAIAEARRRSEALLREGQAALGVQVEAAKRELASSSRSLAMEITETILGSGAPGRPEGSVAG